MLFRFNELAENHVWRVRLGRLAGIKSILVKFARVLLISYGQFQEDQCQLRASALTFYTLLSIVPILAMVFGIAQGFGIEKTIQNEIMRQLQGQEEVATWLIRFSYSFLVNTRGGLIAGIGIAVLFWTVIRVLKSIELSFNAVWNTDKQRTFIRKISDYLAIMLIGPILLVLSGSATVLVAGKVSTMAETTDFLSTVSPVLISLMKLSPYVVTWILFTFIYMVMPNVKVKLLSGLMGGIVAGTFYQIFQWAYISFQIGVSKHNAVYGSFAALPLFLVWLQASWLIVLYGAEISYAFQNAEEHDFEPDCRKTSYAYQKLLTLFTVHAISKKFYSGENGPSAAELSQSLGIPTILLRRILAVLVESQIISMRKPDKDDEMEVAYQPAVDVSKLTIKYVVDAVENRGSRNLPVQWTPEFETISNCIETLDNEIETSDANMLLKNI